MHSSERNFTINKNDELLKERIPFAPLVINSWERSQQIFDVYLTPNDEGKVLYVMLYEETMKDEAFFFTPSSSLKLNETNSILVEIKNTKTQIDLGRGAQFKGQHRTSKNFVLAFVIEGVLRKVSQRFHARSKFVLKNGEDNTLVLIKRLQAMRDDIQNTELVTDIDNVKSEWKKKKEELPQSDKSSRKMLEQKIATCTWLQTQLLNDSEAISLETLVWNTEHKYLKEGKVQRKSVDTAKEIVASIVKTSPSTQFLDIPIDPMGIEFGNVSDARNSHRKKRVGNLKPLSPIKKRDLPFNFHQPELLFQFFEPNPIETKETELLNEVPQWFLDFDTESSKISNFSIPNIDIADFLNN